MGKAVIVIDSLLVSLGCLRGFPIIHCYNPVIVVTRTCYATYDVRLSELEIRKILKLVYFPTKSGSDMIK